MSQTGVASWSQTAASNATADSNINFPEGMAPSQVNDSARAMMASVAKWRDDDNGSHSTGGTATAYTYTSQQGFSSLSQLNGQTLTLNFSATNGANPTLNVDGLGDKPITIDATTTIPIGFITAGTTWRLIYSSSAGAFLIHSGTLASFLPPGSIIPYAGTAAPVGWLLCNGTAVSRATYATLFSIIATVYGTGDGVTTFNVPDLTGRVVAGKESSASRLTSAVSGVDGGTLGSAGGTQSKTIAQANLPSVNFTVSGITLGTNTVNITTGSTGGGSTSIVGSGTGANTTFALNTAIASQGAAASGGSGTALAVVQPTIVLNYIIKT